MPGLDALAREVVEWVLKASERNVVTVTPRRVKKIVRMNGYTAKPRDARLIIDHVIREVEGRRRVEVCRRKTGVRTVFVMPPGVNSPYLE